MKIKSTMSPEQNFDNFVAIEKIKKQILFGKSGPWTRYFTALKFFGIDVSHLITENINLKDQNERYERIVANEKGKNEALKQVIEFYKNELADANKEIIKLDILKNVS
jgi:hypothetical protein